MVRVMVLVIGPSEFMSSGSASTVTLIFQGLRFCSETVRKGDDGIAMCSSAGAAEEFLRRLRAVVALCFLAGDCRLPYVRLVLSFSSLKEDARGSGELRSSGL